MLNIESPHTVTIESLTHPDFDARLKMWAKKLLGSERYTDVGMIHRTNLLIHSMRVKFLSQGLGIVLDEVNNEGGFIDFDHFKVVTMADQHDVTEIITGDLPSPVKRRMTPKQKDTLREQEIRASAEICKSYFSPVTDQTVDTYLDLQREVRDKKTLESQVVNVADKWDALGEKMHEIACGNDTFIPLVENSREVFSELGEYVFWKYLENHPALLFGNIPTGEALSRLPKIDMTKIDENNFEQSMLTQVSDWPVYYRSWLKLSFVNFWKFSPQFIFPGWYPGLGQKLGLN